MDLPLLKALNEERRARRAAILVTDLKDGSQRLVREGETGSHSFGDRFRSGKSGVVEMDGDTLFLTVHLPPPRLVVVGAVHISQALAAMAPAVGLDVTVIDPRTAFATEDRFAGVELIPEWPEDALRDRPLDAYTALAALTHDPKIDDWPLTEALRAGCFYVGALGSRKTHAKRVERLIEAGAGEESLARVHAPIGLDIGAQSPAEIAVAVLAEIIEALRKRPLERPLAQAAE